MDYNFEILSLLDNSVEFDRLHSKFNQFNPFKVLRVDKFEIRHSNVISWLLDPNGNHNLGSFFLNKLLSKTFVKPENEHLVGQYNFMRLHKNSLYDLTVFREVQTKDQKRIDVLAVSESQKLVVLIENKYKSSESEGQLQNYLNFVRNKYAGYTIVPIFLSLDGTTPSHDEYLILDYGDILSLLKAYVEINGDHIFHSVKDFLSHYISVLEEELVQDEEDIELALNIYKKHKDAIDLLYVNGCEKTIIHKLSHVITNLNSDEKEILLKIYADHAETLTFIYEVGNSLMRDAFLEFVHQNQFPNECYHEHIRIPSFILPEWRQLDDVVGKPKGEWWLNNALIAWFERKSDDRMKFIIEVGPLEYEKRLCLLNYLEDNGVRIREKSKEAGAMYTRIYTTSKKVDNWADKAEILRTMNEFYNSSGFHEVIGSISGAIESLVYGQDAEETDAVDATTQKVVTDKDTLANAFCLFARQQGFKESFYTVHNKLPSFIMPEFRLLEEQFGVPKWNWWLNNCAIIWFERLKDNRLKLTIEIGPLESDKRIALMTKFEEKGMKISIRSKRPDASYTKIYTSTCNIFDWSNEMEVLSEMNGLFSKEECQYVIRTLKDIAEHK